MQAALQLRPQRIFCEKDYAVLLLNRDIQLSEGFFTKIWNNASIRHVVDGGSNRFFSFLDKLPENAKESLMFPELASGDFDSITEESMKRLKDNGRCKIVVTEDQDQTDFTKGLAVLQDHIKAAEFTQKLTRVIVICECTGRLDHILSNLNTLHKNVFLQDSTLDETVGVYLMGADNLTYLLPANRQVSMRFEEEVPKLTCGILPLMGPTKFISQGLQWDLTPEMICNFGGLISACNIVIKNNIKITSHDMHSVFTVEINESKYVLPV